MSRKLRVGAALCAFGSMKWFSSVRADLLDSVQCQYLLPKAQTVCNKLHDPTTPRVAVIGAGAAGSSSAWWLHLASDRLGRPIEVEVFERADYIGGRSTIVYPYGNETLTPVELGASIFVTKTNKNLYRATQLFGIDTFNLGGGDSDMGIWDGENLIVTLTGQGFLGKWWDTLKIIWRYGYRSPATTEGLVKEMVSKFVTVYSTTHGWSSVEQVSAMLNFTELTPTDAATYLLSQGVGADFIYQFVEAATRVNYGQDMDKIHALGGLVSMAANGAVTAVGGNFQIFAAFLDRSNAKVHLNTTVAGLQKDGDGWRLDVEDTQVPGKIGTTKSFDVVIVAAPHHSTNISFPSSSAEVSPIPYVHLHVTLFTTTSPSPSPAYFNASEGSSIPSMILTSAEGRRHGGPEPDFNSMNYLQRVSPDREEWVVKIFSKKRIEDDWLEGAFGKGKVGWVLRHEWDAYPVLSPTTKYPPMVLDDGLYYVNGFETFISTMETETIASRGVVDLLLKKKFGQGICPKGVNSTPPAGAEFIWGWDC